MAESKNNDLTEAEAEYVQRQVAAGAKEADVVAFVKAERVGPARADAPAAHTPGGSVPPPPTQPVSVDGVCPACGTILDGSEKPTGLTAVEYDQNIGTSGATVPELRAAAAAAESAEPDDDIKPSARPDAKASTKKGE